MDKHKNLIFVLPALTGTFIFIVIPIFCSFALSFTEWDLLNEIKFVGLDNYKSILSEPEFLQILLNTFVYEIYQRVSILFELSVKHTLSDFLLPYRCHEYLFYTSA